MPLEPESDWAAALERLQRRVEVVDHITIDALWGDQPCVVTAVSGSRVITVVADSPAAAVDKLSDILDKLFRTPSS